MTLADALKAHKEATGQTNQEIADQIGCSLTFARELVIGRRLAKKRDTVERLATMLGESPDFIDHLCQRVPPDMVDFLAGDFATVRGIRERMTG